VRSTILLAAALWLATACPCLAVGIAEPETDLVNLARRATITASGALNDSYHARYVADGVVPAEQSRQDVEQAWCLPRQDAAGAWLRLDWDRDVSVAAIVYWGRTAWLDNENFSACDVLIGSEGTPLVSRILERGARPQMIVLPEPVRTGTLTLRFPSHHGGPNPGASEMGVFASVPTEAQLTAYQYGRSELSPPTLAALRAGTYGFTKLLLVQRQELNPSHVYTYHQENLQPGGGLWTLDFGQDSAGPTKILDSSDGVILDAQLHYDGRAVLFSWKRTMSDFFQLFTVDIEGRGLRQLTRHQSNNFNACWLPDGGIVFLSDRKPAFAYCWKTTTPILWRCNGDGTDPERLSANYLNDFTPSVMQNGRVLYSRWEYVDRPAIPIQSLWSINPDGTMLQGVFGNRILSPATFMDAREIPGGGGQILCTLTAHNGPCRGAVGRIDLARGANSQAAIRNLTPEVNVGQVDKGDGNFIRGPYLHPWPLDDQRYLVSKAGSIELRDYQGQTTETLLPRQGALGFYSPQPVRSRQREFLVPSQRTPGSPPDAWAAVLMQDVYHGLAPVVPRGTIKQLAVVQEVEKPLSISPDLRAFGFQFPVVSCGATYAPKKVWGYAAVEPDGSAHFKVPAQQPIYFLPLDEQGRAVQRMRTFTHLMPGESQSCVGCHADRNYSAPAAAPALARPAAALRRAPAELQEPEWGRQGFSYAHVVQPIWDKHCVDCHSRQDPAGQLELTGDKTDFFNVSYENLVRRGTPSQAWWLGGVGGFRCQQVHLLDSYLQRPGSQYSPDRAGAMGSQGLAAGRGNCQGTSG
jgi:Hydrazine synthase alpha subunit middle domain